MALFRKSGLLILEDANGNAAYYNKLDIDGIMIEYTTSEKHEGLDDFVPVVYLTLHSGIIDEFSGSVTCREESAKMLVASIRRRLDVALASHLDCSNTKINIDRCSDE